MQVLMGIEGFLEPLLCTEGSDRPQALKRRRQVGEDWTPSCREDEGDLMQLISQVPSMHTVHDIDGASMHTLWDTHWWTRGA